MMEKLSECNHPVALFTFNGTWYYERKIEVMKDFS